MATPPYPLTNIPVKKSWLDRHAGWKIPIGCLLVIVFLGAFVVAVFTVVEASFRKSAVYKEALARAERNPLVANRIGLPLRPARVLQGEINVSGSSGTAHMAIPISGPRGKATINLDARKAAGTWEFLTLEAKFDDQPYCVNLLAGAEATNANCDQ